ncbi:MAG: hypothetical protein R3C69_01240 [Geminicoccaceae bacterium]
MKTARAQRAFVPVLVREGLSWDEVTTVAVHSPHLPGVVLDSTLLREYPHRRRAGPCAGLCRAGQPRGAGRGPSIR